MSSSETYHIQAHASRLAGGAARDLADAIHAGLIDTTGWPVVSGRRLVPESALPRIREVFAGRRRCRQGAGAGRELAAMPA